MGGAEGRAARAGRSARSPCTSRITRSTTRRFEGEIPKGNYGAGTVEIWDSGTYELVEEKRDGGLTVRLHGERLEGTWTLVPAHLDGKEQNWLLMRKRDEASAATRPRTTTSRCSRRSPRSCRRGDDWLYEVKWDGYRALGYVRGGEARLVSRNGNDLTGALPEVAKALAKAARSPNCVVDGEVCALDEQGRPSFSAMQQGKPGTPIVYDGLRRARGRRRAARRPAARRSAASGSRRCSTRAQKTVQVSGVFDDGEALFDAAVEQGLEGVMAKRPASRYLEGKRTRDWLKIKTHGRQEFVICGYTKGQGRRAGSFGSLVLGDVPRRASCAGSATAAPASTSARSTSCCASSSRSRATTSPLAVVPKMPKVRKGDVVWVEPKLVCEVRVRRVDARRPPARARRSRGCATTSRAREVHREDPVERAVEARVLKLSNLDKVFWPDEGITKGDLIDYYRAVAPVLVPHLRDRPFTMRRYPDGAFGKAFFQKDAPSHMPDWIPRVPRRRSRRASRRRRRSGSRRRS